MKIGFDGKRAANNLTGLGNYSRSVISNLAICYPDNLYLVYTPKLKEDAQIRKFLGVSPNLILKLPSSDRLAWRMLGIKKQLFEDKVDLYHGLSHELPIGLSSLNIPSVVTVHDLIFLKFPEYYNAVDRFIYELKCKYACQHANKIIAISEKTKADIVHFFGTNPEKIEVVYQSCDDSFKRTASLQERNSVREKFALPEGYLLSVGTIEPRKNLLTLVRALPYIKNDCKLVVVGKETLYAVKVKEEIKRLGLAGRVVFLKDVSFIDLPVIYQLASLFVYPSLYEGFGIPIIEALCSQIPVVAATGSCLEEAGGPGSLYVDPYDPVGLASAIKEVLGSQIKREEMIRQGLVYKERFNHDRQSQQIMNIYECLLLNN